MKRSREDSLKRSLLLIQLEEWDDRLLWPLVLEMSDIMKVEDFERCIENIEELIIDEELITAPGTGG